MQNDWPTFMSTLNLPLISAATDLDNAEVLFDLSTHGLLSVSGKDAKKLLQGQLTCNVEKLNQGRLGAHCTPQGRIISLFYLFQQNETYYLLMPRNMIAIALNALKKYAVFYKVLMQDVSNDFVIVGASGKLVSELATEPTLANISVQAMRSIFVGSDAEMQSALKHLSSTPFLADINAWKHMDIHAQIPQIYSETSGKFLPHQINLDRLNAIDFDKGCYTGQEIIARMHYRGKLKSHLYQGEITQKDFPVPGANVYAHANSEIKTVGNLVDASKVNANYLLLLVTDEQNAKNNHLTLDRDNANFITILTG